jgi:3-phenylpropionate/trans-cinnamate dioxygenase ferredoxin reductase subunit
VTEGAADSRVFVIVGAGQAGGWAAKTLRDQGFAGRVVLIGDEAHPPHERPPLSKAVLTGAKPPESTYLWSREALVGFKIELVSGARVLRIDRTAKRVELLEGAPVAYDRLLLATGGRVRRLPLPGSELAGIHYLRGIEDAAAIRGALTPGARIVVVGGGWIGLEVAAAARTLGAEVTVLEAADRLCGRALPAELGAYLKALHAGKGVDIRLGARLEAFAGTGKVTGAVLAGGETIPASAVVVGVGIVPNVELAAAAGLGVDNGIVVDASGRTDDPDIFAAGDVTNHPNPLLGRRLRLESWENAQNQAIAAAKAMLDRSEPYHEIPWFWSDQYDVNLQLLGLAEGYDDAVTRGDLAKPPFVRFYLKDGKIRAVAAANSPRELRIVKRLMQMGRTAAPAQLADPAVNLQALLKP